MIAMAMLDSELLVVSQDGDYRKAPVARRRDMMMVRVMIRFWRDRAKLYPKTNPRISCVTIQVQVCRKTSFPQLILSYCAKSWSDTFNAPKLILANLQSLEMSLPHLALSKFLRSALTQTLSLSLELNQIKTKITPNYKKKRFFET